MERTRLQVVVGTADGLHQLGAHARTHFAGREITALAREGSRWWAVVDGRGIWCSREDDSWQEVARGGRPRATCLLPTEAGVLVGTAGAHLLRVDGRKLVRVESFDAAEGRQEWYTPWGGPPETRSLSRDPAGPIFVNVHVGGVVRSTDNGRSWRPTVDIERDVHQVLAHPSRHGVVLAAAAVGLGLSTDGGDSWTFETDGLHATYLRAVAVSDNVVLVTASTGPGGKRAAVYRRGLGAQAPFARCRQGLPEWFAGNIDTGCLAAAGTTAALGTADGSLFVSTDRGESWSALATGLPSVRCVAIG